VTELVTAAEARAHLRLDTAPAGTPDDLWLAVFIPAISEAVLGWLKDEWRAYVPEEDSSGVIVDSAGDPVPAVPLVAKFSVKAAVLLELGNAFRNREGEGTDNVVPSDAGWGYTLNKASTALLAPLRKSTLA
jgi:hypothetical protein